jgi:hypothetical protein
VLFLELLSFFGVFNGRDFFFLIFFSALVVEFCSAQIP